MTSQYETNLWLTHVIIVWLTEPIRRCVHWWTQVFKIEGFVCKHFLPSLPPSFIFWLSFHFSRGQNRESCFWVFLCSKTKWKHLLRRLESQWCYIGFLSPFMYLKLVLCTIKVPKVRLKVFLYWQVIVSDHISPYQSAHAFSPHMHSHCSTSPANQVLRSLANTGFQNWGICLQAFPSFPSSSPLFHFLALVSFLARPKPRIPFLDLSLPQNQTETLATQARIACYIGFLTPFISTSQTH